MTLVRTVDENGDEVLVCEENAAGEMVWNPTPLEYEAFVAVDRVHAIYNVLTARVNEAMAGNPSRTEVVESGVPCDGYRVGRGGVAPVYSAETRAAIADKGHYYRYGKRRGGITPDHCLHSLSTFGRVNARLFQGE